MNPLTKIITPSEKELFIKHPALNFIGADVIHEYATSLTLSLLQGFLTEIGGDEEPSSEFELFAITHQINGRNQEKARLRKVVEGAINNLKK